MREALYIMFGVSTRIYVSSLRVSSILELPVYTSRIYPRAPAMAVSMRTFFCDVDHKIKAKSSGWTSGWWKVSGTMGSEVFNKLWQFFY
jgi:hypothetical protein